MCQECGRNDARSKGKRVTIVRATALGCRRWVVVQFRVLRGIITVPAAPSAEPKGPPAPVRTTPVAAPAKEEAPAAPFSFFGGAQRRPQISAVQLLCPLTSCRAMHVAEGCQVCIWCCTTFWR